jgi:hypothetical protein
MIAGFLFSDGSGNTTSWLVLPIFRLEWEAIAMYNWGSAVLAWLYHSLCDGVLWSVKKFQISRLLGSHDMALNDICKRDQDL